MPADCYSVPVFCISLYCQVGVTAMLIASKYEEIWAPEVNDFVYISDKAYTRCVQLPTSTNKHHSIDPVTVPYAQRPMHCCPSASHMLMKTMATLQGGHSGHGEEYAGCSRVRSYRSNLLPLCSTLQEGSWCPGRHKGDRELANLAVVFGLC